MRLVYVYGTDYCGSTLLDRLFWNVDGVGAPGEIHWLYDAPRRGRIPTCGEHEVERACTLHGADCPVLGRPWVEQHFDLCFLYEAVAERLGAECLVSSDKNWNHYRRLTTHCDRGQMVVLAKSPLAYAWSRKKHEGTSFDHSLRDWVRTYVDTVPKGAVCVTYERLASQPNSVMNHLCAALGLPSWRVIDPQTYMLNRSHHLIGGNPSALSARPIEPDTRWLTDISPMDRCAGALSTTAEAAYAQLCKESL